jgi:small multidrug resistance family-3 protein
MKILASFILILVAGLCEISSRYFAWQWLKAGWGVAYGVLAAGLIFTSILLPIFQGGRFQFGRSTAAYGTLFVVLALLWSWRIDQKTPDIFDIIGASLCLAGISIMMYWPRS